MSWRCAARRAGRTGPAARSPPPSPLLLLLLWTAALAPGAAAGDEAAPAGASVCYASPPSVGSVQELVQRAAVVIEGKLHSPRRRQQGALNREAAAAAGEAGAWGGERPPPANGTVPAWPTAPAPSAAEPGAEAPYLVKVHQVWAAKAGGLKKDSLLTVRLGAWGHPAFPSCGRLKEDSRYIFFMEPEANSSGRAPAAFRASFPPLETGRNLKKEVSRVLCKRCGHCCCCCCCCCWVTSVVSDSVRPDRRQPTRLPRPWDPPGKNAGWLRSPVVFHNGSAGFYQWRMSAGVLVFEGAA